MVLGRVRLLFDQPLNQRKAFRSVYAMMARVAVSLREESWLADRGVVTASHFTFHAGERTVDHHADGIFVAVGYNADFSAAQLVKVSPLQHLLVARGKGLACHPPQAARKQMSLRSGGANSLPEICSAFGSDL